MLALLNKIVHHIFPWNVASNFVHFGVDRFIPPSIGLVEKTNDLANLRGGYEYIL